MRRALLLLLLVLVLAALLPGLLGRLGINRPDPAHLPPPGRKVAIPGGLELAVVEQGTGPTVVLIHGLPSNAADWGAVPQQLAALGHHVVVYDRTGFGYSSRPPEEADRYTFDSNARELHQLLEALHIEHAVLVGWSYGGGIVQRFAAEAPGKADALVLLASVGPKRFAEISPLERLIAMPFAVPLLEWISGVPPLGRRMTHDGVVTAFSNEAAVPVGWTERTSAMLRLPGTLRSYVFEMRRFDRRALQPEILRKPTLILHGEDDRDVPFAQGEELHRAIPGSELVGVPGGSHMLPATHPELVAERIHRFAAALP